MEPVLHFGDDYLIPLCLTSESGATMVFDWDVVTCPACLAKKGQENL